MVELIVLADWGIHKSKPCFAAQPEKQSFQTCGPKRSLGPSGGGQLND